MLYLTVHIMLYLLRTAKATPFNVIVYFLLFFFFFLISLLLIDIDDEKMIGRTRKSVNVLILFEFF